MLKFRYRLKELRAERGVSQVALAERLRISQQTVASYEQGRTQPNFSLLIEIAEFFSVSTDYLLGITDVALPVSAFDAPVFRNALELLPPEAVAEIQEFTDSVVARYMKKP